MPLQVHVSIQQQPDHSLLLSAAFPERQYCCADDGHQCGVQDAWSQQLAGQAGAAGGLGAEEQDRPPAGWSLASQSLRMDLGSQPGPSSSSAAEAGGAAPASSAIRIGKVRAGCPD
jgi:hypothetical protein